MNVAAGVAKSDAQAADEDIRDSISVHSGDGPSDEEPEPSARPNRSRAATNKKPGAKKNAARKRLMDDPVTNGDHTEARPSKKAKTAVTSSAIVSTRGKGSKAAKSSHDVQSTNAQTATSGIQRQTRQSKPANQPQVSRNATSTRQQGTVPISKSSGKLNKPSSSNSTRANKANLRKQSDSNGVATQRRSPRLSQASQTADPSASNQAHNANEEPSPEAVSEPEAEAEPEHAGEAASPESDAEDEASLQDVFRIRAIPEFHDCWSSVIPSLRRLDTLALKRLNTCKTDASGKTQTLQEAARRFREQIELSSRAPASQSSPRPEPSFAGANPALFNDAVAAWTGESFAAERDAPQARIAVNEIWGYAVPQMLRALLFAIRSYRPQHRLSSTDHKIIAAMFAHIDGLRMRAQFVEAERNIAPSLKDKHNKAIAYAQDNKHIGVHTRTIQTTLSRDQDAQKLSSQLALFRQTQLKVPDPAIAERAARELACQKYWDRLHSLRLMAAIPPGKLYVSSADMQGTTATPLGTAQVSANLLTDQVELWFSSDPTDLPDAEDLPLSPPWSIVKWDPIHIDELANSLHDHKGDPKAWAHEIYKLCKPWLHPATGLMEKGPLAKYRVADIVDQGMWTARVDLYDHWRKRMPYSPYMAMEDPRLVDQGVLKDVLESWPVAAGTGQLPAEDRGADADVEDEVESG